MKPSDELKKIQHAKNGMIKLFGDSVTMAINSGLTFQQAEDQLLPAFKQALGYMTSREVELEDRINDAAA